MKGAPKKTDTDSRRGFFAGLTVAIEAIPGHPCAHGLVPEEAAPSQHSKWQQPELRDTMRAKSRGQPFS